MSPPQKLQVVACILLQTKYATQKPNASDQYYADDIQCEIQGNIHANSLLHLPFAYSRSFKPLSNEFKRWSTIHLHFHSLLIVLSDVSVRRKKNKIVDYSASCLLWTCYKLDFSIDSSLCHVDKAVYVQQMHITKLMINLFHFYTLKTCHQSTSDVGQTHIFSEFDIK